MMVLREGLEWELRRSIRMSIKQKWHCLIDKLYRKIGEVEVENDWFKKSSVFKGRGAMGIQGI